MNDIVKFAETVQQMRSAQNEYFRTKAPIAMAKARKIEKEVDDMVRVSVRPQSINQADMFGKAIPVTDPELKHEIKFCLMNDMVVNEHGRFVYNSANGIHSCSLPDILSEYRDWLKQQGVIKDYQKP